MFISFFFKIAGTLFPGLNPTFIISACFQIKFNEQIKINNHISVSRESKWRASKLIYPLYAFLFFYFTQNNCWWPKQHYYIIYIIVGIKIELCIIIRTQCYIIIEYKHILLYKIILIIYPHWHCLLPVLLKIHYDWKIIFTLCSFNTLC